MSKNMSNKLFFIVLIAALAGCSANQKIDDTVTAFDNAESKVHMGDLTSDVLAILEPTQIDAHAKKWETKHDSFNNNGTTIDIYYFRSSAPNNGLTAEDEYTPYVFKDGRLAGIGWGMIREQEVNGYEVPTFNAKGKENTETVY
jgi:outer membrane murein-binding lipoprotein Lpp